MASLVLVGDYKTLSAQAKERGVAVATFEDAVSFVEALPGLQEPKLFLVQFFVPHTTAFDLMPEIRRLWPSAQIWLDQAYRTEDIHPKWLRSETYNRIVSGPSFADIEIALSLITTT